MNKTAIKNFAISARVQLLTMVKVKAASVGITEKNIAPASSTGPDYVMFPTTAGTQTTLSGSAIRQRASLVKRIQSRGFDAVMEEAAYTWFNRIIAIRFMEVNDYLPSRVRVLSSTTEGKYEPDLVTEAPDVNLSFTEDDRKTIDDLRGKQKLDALFQFLFIKQCNEFSAILPELFENTSSGDLDFTELLLDLSFTKPDGVVRNLLSIPESDFTDAVEIIGWMYQYYNTELKDETFARLKKNIKIDKDHIPAATQLFTPDWIVRYMVENSLGRLWVEGHANTTLKTGWKYYLEEAEQEDSVKQQLAQIRAEYAKLTPQDIKVIDPCMGSGHILVYAFEVLIQIYESAGYADRDAVPLILENNLFGLDIDDRAYQLAWFALMMKARKYDRRAFERNLHPHVYAIQESPADLAVDWITNAENRQTLCYIKEVFTDAKEYGSILNVESRNYSALNADIDAWEKKHEQTLENGAIADQLPLIRRLISQAVLLSQKYDVVVTNPPYMGSSGMSAKLSAFVKEKYPDSWSDLFGIFIEKCNAFVKTNRFIAMITQQAWMFLGSFENLRKNIVQNESIINMAHLGPHAFDEIGGEIVQTVSWILFSGYINNYKGVYKKLIKYFGEKNKEENFISKDNLFYISSSKYINIPGNPIAYWTSDNFTVNYLNKKLKEFGDAKQGLITGDNNRFLRVWFEIDRELIHKKWIPYNKGGEFRRWYGNNEYIVNWENDGYEIKNFFDNNGKLRSRPQNLNYYFKENISWTKVTMGKFSTRYIPKDFIFSDAGSSFFCNNTLSIKYILAFTNSVVAQEYLDCTNPTMNYGVGQICDLPVKINDTKKDIVNNFVQQNVSLSKSDWDAFETSWDFVRHPLLPAAGTVDYKDPQSHALKIADAYKKWSDECESRFASLKKNEEELNRIFIDIYGLQDELKPEEEDSDVTVRRADLTRDIKSFVSYAVGCMFGRYSLSCDGLAFAGGEMDMKRYQYYYPDEDNVIPITDEEYFDDDIVSRFCRFVKIVYGEATLTENLEFIANALGTKGDSARQRIRSYFLTDFYKDHCSTYSVTGSGKRPIYWQFDSGKENAFKALIYLHRYDENTVARVRTDYLHNLQKKLEGSVESCNRIISSTIATPHEQSDAQKRLAKLSRQIDEIKLYDKAIGHVADQRISLDLDDGVNVNYEKFQGIEVPREGQKVVKINLLAER